MKVEHELTEINLDQTRALTLAQDRSLDEFVRDDKRFDKLISSWLDYKLAPLRTADPSVVNMLQHASEFKVTNQQSCEDAAELTRELKAQIERLEAHAKEVKDVFNSNKQIVLDEEKTATGRIKEVIQGLSTRSSAWRQAEQKRVDVDNRRRLEEEQRKAQAQRDAEIADAKAEAKQFKEVITIGDPRARAECDALARQAQQRARELAAAPLPVPIIELQAAPKIAGQHFRDDWQVEITELHLIPDIVIREFCCEDKPYELLLAFLKRKANKQRERFSVPGVRAWNEPALVTKSR